MGLSLKIFLAVSISFGSLLAETPLQKPHVGYLVKSKHLPQAIDDYRKYVEKTGKQDFDILEELSLALLDAGAKSTDTEEQILSLFGASLANTTLPQSFLYDCITRNDAHVQIACLQLLGSMQDDRFDELINRAMSSPFFITRVHAANLLAIRKTRTAVGQIESLMYRVPEEMRYLFAEFFARIGTPEAIAVLKQLINANYHQTSIATILAAAQYGRDDLISNIRSKSTQQNRAEQEASAAALGIFRDHQSIKVLQRLSKSASDSVSLAAIRSLNMLGIHEGTDAVITLAKKGNLFAIQLLGELHEGEDKTIEKTLYALLKNSCSNVKLNAAMALLRKKDPSCISVLLGFLIRDVRDIGFIPQTSLGGSLSALKTISSIQEQKTVTGMDFPGYALYIRELLLRECLELPEDHFLFVIETLFLSKQKDLIPLVSELLFQKGTPSTIRLLKKFSQMAGAPLVRTYCNLTLMRLNQGEEYTEKIRAWIREQKGQDLVRLRPPIQTPDKPIIRSFELSPAETSTLLVSCCQALAERHDKKSIEIFLDLIRDGNAKNRSLLSAILLNAIR